MAIKDSALRGIEAAVLPTMKMKMSIHPKLLLV